MSSKEPRGIYVRVSTEDQAADDKASVPNQKKESMALCERRGYPVHDIYIDDENYVATHGRSKGKMVAPSSKRRDRPEYLRMIGDIRAGKIKGIVAWKWDRLGAGSGIYPLMDAIEEAPHPIAIETVKGGEIPPLMLSMLTSFRAQVLQDMHDRLIMGGKARLEGGKFWGGNRLYGYDMVDGQRVVNPDEAKWVVLIFEWYTSGVKVREIRKRLITENAPQKGHKSTKRPWNEGVIRDILRNPAYTGRTIITWDGQPYELEYEPIISKGTFQKAQKIMERNRTWPDRNRKIPYLLSGLLRCADCGKLWHAKGKRYYYLNGERHLRKTPYRSYRCPTGAAYPNECPNRRAIGAEHLEEAVWNAVKEFLQDGESVKEKIDGRIAELRETRQERQQEADRLSAKFDKLQQERQWLILQARKGVISQADFEAQIAILDIEATELTLAYQEAAADIPDDLDELWWTAWEQIAKETKAFQDLDFEGRRKLLETLVDEIVIDPQVGTLYLHGTLERVVQFNIERLRPDCDGSRGNGWAQPVHG